MGRKVKHIGVLVADWDKKEQRISLTDQVVTQWQDPLRAFAEAVRSRAKGKIVIIRPTFNEIDEEGSFFREWHSTDGMFFQEKKFYLHDLSGNSLIEEPPTVREFRDTQIVLPNIPPDPICACEDVQVIEAEFVDDELQRAQAFGY